MGSAGDAYDNAMCESFFAALECELLGRRRFRMQAEARMAVFEFIEGFYNPTRRHSSIGYLSPIEYEKRAAQNIGRGAFDPDAPDPAAVLAAVKERPGGHGASASASVPAVLGRRCARQLHMRAGRDEKMISAEPKDRMKGLDSLSR